mgnify:CR=1 FL=1
MYCISISGRDTREVTALMEKASVEADILELRLDMIGKTDIRVLLEASRVPVIATYRTTAEGGKGQAGWKTVSRLLGEAIKEGADYVDVEWAMPEPIREKLFESRGRSRIIASLHLDHTPEKKVLSRLLEHMAGSGPDVVKIVTTAGSVRDNLRVLELIPEAEALGVSIIAFAMGPLGRVSRLLCVPMGGLMTFACLDESSSMAPGQMTLRQMRRITEVVFGGN